MKKNWNPLNRRKRFKQYWCRYAPLPFKRCMVCGRWFWDWHLIMHVRWGIPEYCSRKCSDRELETLRDALSRMVKYGKENEKG